MREGKMDGYKKLVIDLFESESTHIIANSSSEHAAVLYTAFFSYAQEEICIYCNSLNSSVFGNRQVIERAREFLNKQNTRLHIGVTEVPDKTTGFFDVLKSFHAKDPKKVEVLSFPKMSADGKFINFSVMDKKAYRLEPDSSKCEAIACANDVLFATKLRDAFFACRKPKES